MWAGLNRAVTTKFTDRIRVSGTVEVAVGDHRLAMFSDWDDHFVDQLCFRANDYRELTELRLFAAFAARSRVILDVGANTGVYSIVSAKVNPSAAVHAFEPYPVNFRRLQKNLALNGLSDRVRAAELALGDAEQTIEFTVPTNGQICDVASAHGEFTRRHYQAWLSYENIEVRQTRLDSYSADQALPSVDLIKIDVESHELSVLEGAVDTLKRHSPVILAEIFVDDARKTFFEKMLQPLGYHCYLVTPNALIRAENLNKNPDCWHFLLSRKKSSDFYLSYSDMNSLVQQLS